MCMMSGLMQMIKEGGMRSLWRGNGVNIIKIAPESALKFMAYEQIKRLIGSDKETLSILERFVAGSLAGVIAQSTIYPMEVIILLFRCYLESLRVLHLVTCPVFVVRF
ncbi:hypothetical protein GOODEAATRI_020966 [Goodea atripinnis]|uniref:Uncharacterized protein n=1 Tax=Goodea atripinnis TaxID=208336 RepID=A0ABV0NCC9_9TELE